MAAVFSLPSPDVVLSIEQREGGGLFLSIDSPDRTSEILVDAVELARALVGASDVFTQGLSEIIQRTILGHLLVEERGDLGPYIDDEELDDRE